MRDVGGSRDWLTREEVKRQVVAGGLPRVTDYEMWKAFVAFRLDMPRRVYGVNRYTQAHVEAVRIYAAAKAGSQQQEV
jgi:hypothetical protein